MIHNLDIPIEGLDSQCIGGIWHKSSDDLQPVVSPANEQIITRTALPTIANADHAVQLARHTFDHGPWPELSIDERVRHCARLCDAMESRLPALNRAWALESGATITHGELINDLVGASIWRKMLAMAPDLPWEEQRDDALLLREPIGTVLSIMTFNGPIILMAMKIIPALLAGCTVVGKHAPESQLTSRLLSEAVTEANLPLGVLTLLPAGTEVTQHLVSHPSIDMVSLTGGTAVGIEVVKRTADRLARTTLELGGKSPAIILEDADLEQTMATLVPGSTSYMGQVCVSLSRVLAPASRYDEVVEALAEKYREIQFGDPLDPNSQQGPMSVERGRIRTEAHVERAKQQGARVVTGGRRPPQFDRGWWYEPTLIANADHSMDIIHQEVFGPVTTVVSYSNQEEAITLANDSDFGLAASVYSRDEAAAMNVARQLKSGSVAINTAGISFMQPFGGYKKSGWGRECGAEGILEFTQIKQIIKA